MLKYLFIMIEGIHEQSDVFFPLVCCVSHFQLVEGVYQLKLRVRSLNSRDWGEAYVNVTVHPANRVNSPPVPVILPSNDVMVCLLLSLSLFLFSAFHM